MPWWTATLKQGNSAEGSHVMLTSVGGSMDEDWRYFMESSVLCWAQLDMVQYSTQNTVIDFTPLEKPLSKKSNKTQNVQKTAYLPPCLQPPDKTDADALQNEAISKGGAETWKAWCRQKLRYGVGDLYDITKGHFHKTAWFRKHT